MDSMRKYWTVKQIEARTNELTEILKKEKVSAKMIRLVKRRFGDLNALHSAFICSVSDVHAQLLLLDLSEGGSNLNDGEREGEEEGEGEGEGANGNINDGNNDAKRNRSRESRNQGREKIFETDCQKVWMAVTESNLPANTSSAASFSTSSTSSSIRPVSKMAHTASIINFLNLKNTERTKRQTVLTLSPKMKKIVEESDNQTEYPSYIFPVYLFDEKNNSENNNENEIEIINDSESSDSEERKKKKKNKNKKEKKIIPKKKCEENSDSVAWCEIFSKDEIFISETKGFCPLPDVIHRKSLPLFVVVISGIDLLEAFAISYQMITDKNSIRTNMSEINSVVPSQFVTNVRNEMKCKNKSNSDETKMSKTEEEDFEILLVSTALNVLQNKWPQQLINRIVPMHEDNQADKETEESRGSSTEKVMEEGNAGNLSRQKSEIVLLIDNVKGEKKL